MSAPAADADAAAALPWYEGIARERVTLVHTPAQAEAALTELSRADALGFDTESRPVFTRGERSAGPHLVQLATDTRVFLFQVDTTAGIGVLATVLAAPQIVKAGFGLGDDLKLLRSKLGIETVNVVDLAIVLRNGQKNPVGAKTAVARYFGRTLRKSKRITTTNWALPTLSEEQIRYAADDAHVALRIYRLWLAGRRGA